MGRAHKASTGSATISEGKRVRLLAIEDEPKVAKALREGLEGESYSVALAHSGEEGYFLATSEPFDLVILDWMLPGRSGLEVLTALRRQKRQLPVLLLTAKDSVEDRVLGLDAGADDYLVKPFAFPELLARVRALLRRGKTEVDVTLQLEDLHIDLITRTVRRGTRAIDLTIREFEILEYLLRRQGQIVSREMLAADVWKETERHTPLDNVIDVHMVRLRRKVDEGSALKLLHTVRGVGFVLKSGAQ